MSRRGEMLLALAASVVVTVVAMWRTVTSLTWAVSGDLGDPLYFAWQLAWVSHQARLHPLTFPQTIWTTNAFSGAPDSLAYTDVVLGYLPLTLVTGEGQSGALAQLNLAILLATALACFSGYLLARVLGSGVAGAVLAAAALGFAPWRDTHVIHVNILSTGGMVIAVALLLHGHAWSLRDGWRPERIRARWVAAGWAVACYQLLFGFALGIWFSYTLAVIGALLGAGWLLRGRHRSPLPRRLVVADALGGLAYLGTVVLLLVPHLRVLQDAPEAERSVDMLGLFSPPWYGLLTAGTWNTFWGERQDAWRASIAALWPPEMFMSPGILLIVLAAAGLVVSVWSRRQRAVLALLCLALAVAATGTRGPDGGALTYLPLYEYLPGWDQLRTPGRLMIWVTVLLAVLAAGLVSAVAGRATAYLRSDRDRVTAGAAGLLLCLPAVGVFAEGRDRVPRWEVSRAPIDLTALEQPVLILPSGLVADYHLMFWSTEGWPVIANGDSSFDTAAQAGLRAAATTFPDAASVAALRERGVRTVVVVRSRTGPGWWAGAGDAPVNGLGITRTDTGDAVVFDLEP